MELIFDIDKNLPNKMYGDSLRIRQVIINIANNAIKFTEAGFVKLALKLNQMAEADMVNLEISIEDSGQGIKPEDWISYLVLFSRWIQRKIEIRKGTGAWTCNF